MYLLAFLGPSLKMFVHRSTFAHLSSITDVSIYKRYLLPTSTTRTATESRVQVTKSGNQKKLLHLHRHLQPSLQWAPTAGSWGGGGERPPSRRSHCRSLQPSTTSQLCLSRRIRDLSHSCPPGWKNAILSVYICLRYNHGYGRVPAKHLHQEASWHMDEVPSEVKGTKLITGRTWHLEKDLKRDF